MEAALHDGVTPDSSNAESPGRRMRTERQLSRSLAQDFNFASVASSVVAPTSTTILEGEPAGPTTSDSVPRSNSPSLPAATPAARSPLQATRRPLPRTPEPATPEPNTEPEGTHVLDASVSAQPALSPSAHREDSTSAPDERSPWATIENLLVRTLGLFEDTADTGTRLQAGATPTAPTLHTPTHTHLSSPRSSLSPHSTPPPALVSPSTSPERLSTPPSDLPTPSSQVLPGPHASPPLPPNWIVLPIYYNTATGRISWERPST